MHSYAAQQWEGDPDALLTWATHHVPFLAAVEDGPLAATQFHPEKSGDAGAALLANWVRGARLSPVPDQRRLILLPAVDVVEGRAVRLVQGKAGSETEYGSALDAALTWQRDGAEWIHLVDLDAAFGRGSNRELLAEVVGKLDVAVELSGGIRDDESLTAALATGCARVNLGTAALENPQWCAKVVAEHGEKVAVGLDVKIDLLAWRRAPAPRARLGDRRR